MPVFWCKRESKTHRSLKFGSHFQDTAWLSKLAALQRLHMDTFYPDGIEIELVFAPWTVVSEIQADFQKCHIWAWNLEFEKFQKLLSTLRGRIWAYFRSTGSGFRDTGRFWKLSYLGMKPGIWKKGQKLHMEVALKLHIEVALPKYSDFIAKNKLNSVNSLDLCSLRTSATKKCVVLEWTLNGLDKDIYTP